MMYFLNATISSIISLNVMSFYKFSANLSYMHTSTVCLQ